MTDALEKAEDAVEKSKLSPALKAALAAVVAVLTLLGAVGGFLRPSIVEAMHVETTEAHRVDIDRIERELPTKLADELERRKLVK